MAEPPSPPPPLHLTIRFTTSTPDLLLTITSPATTTTLTLKREIRTNLPPETSTHRLRLIHSGKVLPDTSTLSEALKLPPPPRQPTSTHSDPSGKGKAPIRDLPPPPPPQRVYIHCSIGDPLTPSELVAEAAAADDTSRAPIPLSSAAQQQQQQRNASSTTTPAPRGFDRLLTAGFTPQEIAALRSQFLDLQSHTHTPDTMPSASELRTLEDRWIDESTSPNTTNNNAGDANDGFGGFGDGEGGGLEDLLWGNVMGFFWPVGAVVWLLREEGVWSKRRQIAVFTGMLVNVAFSVLRVTS